MAQPAPRRHPPTHKATADWRRTEGRGRKTEDRGQKTGDIRQGTVAGRRNMVGYKVLETRRGASGERAAGPDCRQVWTEKSD